MKLTKTLIITFILTSFSMLAIAQSSNKYTGALLWKISGNGLSKPSYILGTHHLTHVSFVDSIPGLKKVIENTEQTVGELLMADQMAMQAKLQQASIMPADKNYSTILTASEYANLDAGLKEIFNGQAGMEQFKQYKPGMISMLYSITLYTKVFPTFNPMGHEAIDAYVQRIASEKGKSLLGLETVEDQIYALFDAEPLADQAKTLACSVSHKDFMIRSVKQLDEYYRAKKLTEMYDLAFNNPEEPCQMSKTYENAINKDRNNKWLEKLPQIMKGKSSLIAVGALHLAGEEGLLYQLAKKGYKVEAVK